MKIREEIDKKMRRGARHEEKKEERDEKKGEDGKGKELAPEGKK